jgi:hypothetical protein
MPVGAETAPVNPEVYHGRGSPRECARGSAERITFLSAPLAPWRILDGLDTCAAKQYLQTFGRDSVSIYGGVMASARDVAAYILSRQGRMTAMKLQKLVYYSQAWSVVWDERAAPTENY